MSGICTRHSIDGFSLTRFCLSFCSSSCIFILFLFSQTYNLLLFSFSPSLYICLSLIHSFCFLYMHIVLHILSVSGSVTVLPYSSSPPELPSSSQSSFNASQTFKANSSAAIPLTLPLFRLPFIPLPPLFHSHLGILTKTKMLNNFLKLGFLLPLLWRFNA